MKKKRSEKIFAMGILILLVGLIGFASAIETSYCCEKLENSNLFCQNAPQAQCDTSGGFKAVPTSCEATSYCKLGTCIDAQEGDCIENTPLSACNKIEGGVWKDQSSSEIAQCKLGCCLLGDQAAFVTQTRCNKLSAVYGLEINFRQDIQNEAECLSTANSAIEGACVYEKDFVRTCKRLTQKECNEMKTNTENQNVGFYEGYLCSAVELGTDCARSEKTTCIPNKDEVYFVDTCGNLANIYDSNKQNDASYWEKIVSKADGCQLGTAKNSAAFCGNCNYLQGSVCAEFNRKNEGEIDSTPKFGDYFCRDLSCDYDVNSDGKIDSAEHFEHGESWCQSTFPESLKKSASDNYAGKDNPDLNTLGTDFILINPDTQVPFGWDISADGKFWEFLGEGKGVSPNPTSNDDSSHPFQKIDEANLPGSRYYRMICSYGEVIPEPCADFRQEVCIQSNIPESEIESPSIDLTDDVWSNAACRPNLWQDCAQQTNPTDCQDISKRDCVWFSSPLNVCAPTYAPGLNFWDDENGEASTICSQANIECSVTLEKGSKGGKNWWGIGEFLDYPETIKSSSCAGVSNQNLENVKDKGGLNHWKSMARTYSKTLGDCGEKTNYLGFMGTSGPGEVERRTGVWN